MSRVAVSSPQPRRVSTPSWLDLRLVLGVLLVVAAVVVGALVVSRATRTYPVLSASRTLAAGTVLRAADLQTVQVQLPEHGDGAYVTAVHDAVGKQLARSVAKGELVRVDSLTAVVAHTTLTVPFAAGAAPALRSGERIEIWISAQSCPSVVLLADVTVQSVQAGAGGSFGAAAGAQDVVINVDPALADRVIAALNIDQAHIRAGVLTGSSAPTSTPASAASASPTAPSQQPGTAAGLPPDLAACTSSSAPR
jgi:hypothetical protein